MKRFSWILSPLLGISLAFLVCILLLIGLKESPLVLWEAIYNTLFVHFGLGYTLFYATPFLFTGLSVAVCAHCGLFNIGAEGQLYVGALATVAFAAAFPSLPWPLAILGAGVSAFLAGGFWGSIAGFLKAKRGTHEVIVTILLNFIAYYFVDYFILYRLKNWDVQNTETVSVTDSYKLTLLSDLTAKFGQEWFFTTPVNTAFFIAVLAAVIVYWLLYRTTIGYEFRATGFNPTASRFNGISLSKNTILVFALSGGLAGLVGVNEVLGNQHRLIQGFSPEYGFTGIAVALLARNHPLGIILSALLFGALHNSSRELEFASEKVTKEVALVLQAVLIAFVASRALIEKILLKRKAKKDA